MEKQSKNVENMEQEYKKSIYIGNISLFIPSYRYSCFEKHNSA